VWRECKDPASRAKDPPPGVYSRAGKFESFDRIAKKTNARAEKQQGSVALHVAAPGFHMLPYPMNDQVRDLQVIVVLHEHVTVAGANFRDLW
jgi:hypothetical protein